ncbi:MAG: dodecin domain-containing protein [Acidobacteria bacterium]|nr:dodecin domain-containing protein [Acidobacteriota bacterium]
MAVARISEIVASSGKSWQEAADQGFKRACKTLRGITGLRILEQTAAVNKDKITEYRVRMKVTFVLEK